MTDNDQDLDRLQRIRELLYSASLSDNKNVGGWLRYENDDMYREVHRELSGICDRGIRHMADKYYKQHDPIFNGTLHIAAFKRFFDHCGFRIQRTILCRCGALTEESRFNESSVFLFSRLISTEWYRHRKGFIALFSGVYAVQTGEHWTHTKDSLLRDFEETWDDYHRHISYGRFLPKLRRLSPDSMRNVLNTAMLKSMTEVSRAWTGNKFGCSRRDLVSALHKELHRLRNDLYKIPVKHAHAGITDPIGTALIDRDQK